MFLKKLLDKPKARLIFAEWLLIIALIAWPLTQVTIFAHEPPGILGLSWFAIILTAVDIVITTDVRDEQDSNSDDTQ